MGSKKGWLSSIVTMALCIIIVAGCSSNNNAAGTNNASNKTNGNSKANEAAAANTNANTNEGTAGDSNEAPVPEKLEPVTLKIMLPGVQPDDYSEVKAEVEKRLADTLNVKIDITYVAWADLATKTQVTLASGEPYDLIFDAPWLHMNQMIAAGYYEPLDDLLAQYGTNIVNTRPQQMWDANKYGGKVMGIPLGIFMVQGHSYSVRKDLREQLSLPPITTYEDLIKYAYAVKEKFPNITPIIPGGGDGAKEYTWAGFRQNDATGEIRPSHGMGQSLMLYYRKNDGKVYNMFDDRDPLIWSWITEARQLYKDKIIDQDVMSIKDWGGKFYAGKSAITPSRSFSPDYNGTLEGNSPGAEMEAVKLMDITTPKVNIINFQMDNFINIPTVSKNKERAIRFLDWANIKENYDLIGHGIEGKSWEAVGDDKYRDLVSTAHGLTSFAITWNPVHERYPEQDNEETIKYKKFVGDGDSFTADILTGFSFDGEPVKNEIAQFTATQSKYYNVIFNGVVDPDDYMEKFKKEGAASLKKIQVELEKQIQVFLAAK